MSFLHAPAPSVGAVIVMGVAGCGKSTLGQELAARLGCGFLEGDAFHTPENIAKMAHGTPLDDADRWPWLDTVGAALGRATQAGGSAIAGCSALKRSYRERLAAAAGRPLRFIHLTGARELLAARMSARTAHFMPTTLLDSQLATLEPLQPDEPALVLDVAQPPPLLVAAALRWLTAPDAGHLAAGHLAAG